jgi:hypothetical protein
VAAAEEAWEMETVVNLAEKRAATAETKLEQAAVTLNPKP